MSAHIIPVMEQQRVLKLSSESFQGANIEEAIQKLHSHERKCENEK